MTDLRLKRRDFLYGLAGLSGSIIASQVPSSPVFARVRINGAGASFPAPLYQRWFVEYNQVDKNTQVNYQSVGSGSGVKQFVAGTVDFGASDVAMKDEDIAKVSQGVVLLPVTAGAIVVAYNNKDIPNLQLSRQQYVDIFLGKITDWKQLGAPKSKSIKIVHRSDGSGTTGVFTKHLSAISSDWQKQVGEGKTVQWKTGIGAKGNEGVTATLKQTDGAIGYVEYGYATKNNVTTAELQNQAGSYVKASLTSATTTLSQVTLPTNLRAFITDPVGTGSYPIVTYTWILAYQNYDNPQMTQVLKQVLKWCVQKDGGQQYSADLGYIPLPENVIAKVNNAIDTIN